MQNMLADGTCSQAAMEGRCAGRAQSNADRPNLAKLEAQDGWPFGTREIAHGDLRNSRMPSHNSQPALVGELAEDYSKSARRPES